MAGKTLIRIFLTGSEIVGRAFTAALRREFTASQEAAKRRAQSTRKISKGISLDEAYRILNVTKKLDKEEVNTHFKNLFDANDKSKGGSFYLQSKIVRAKERIDQEFD